MSAALGVRGMAGAYAAAAGFEPYEYGRRFALYRLIP
jgi:hypothetical protein